MKSRNPAFENSLACLQHPITLVSIFVLLLNDHVLKVVSPSWLTGKLSDFAGLFFFPFIVSAGLSLILSKFNLSRERIGQIAFGIVAIWFVLLKTVPIVNSLTAQFASLFIGAPARLILDPTDLIALIAMLPAWRLWQNQSGVAFSRKAYISLAVGVMASLASSPALAPFEFEDVVSLAYQDGYLYVGSSETNEHYNYASNDFGENWQMEWGAYDVREHKLPIQDCDPTDLQTCYQVDGTDKVSISQDGGRSWQIGWEVPPERREYVERVSGEIATYDLIIAQDGDSRYLFVARGRNGILRKQLPDGEWIQLGIEEAQPVPFYAPNISYAIKSTRRELIIWLGIAFVAMLISHTAIWSKFAKEKKVVNLLSWIYFTFNFALVFIIVELLIAIFLKQVWDIFFYTLSKSSHISSILGWIVATIALVALFAWLILRTPKLLLKIAPDTEAKPHVVLYCALTVVGVFLFGYLPWVLWAFGAIPAYQATLAISILISVLITATGYYLIRKAK